METRRLVLVPGWIATLALVAWSSAARADTAPARTWSTFPGADGRRERAPEGGYASPWSARAATEWTAPPVEDEAVPAREAGARTRVARVRQDYVDLGR